MANEYYISAGTQPIDRSLGATAQSYYISAGITPDDEVVSAASVPNYGFFEDDPCLEIVDIDNTKTVLGL